MCKVTPKAGSEAKDFGLWSVLDRVVQEDRAHWGKDIPVCLPENMAPLTTIMKAYQILLCNRQRITR